jgi:hypothetical protein
VGQEAAAQPNQALHLTPAAILVFREAMPLQAAQPVNGVVRPTEADRLTEAEWRGCVDPAPMLRCLGRRAGEEQLRKFGIAFCRRIWPLLEDERSRRAVEAVEGYVQGVVTREHLHAVCDDAEWPYQDANLRAEDPENANPEPDRVAESAAYAAHMLAWPWFGWDFAVEVATGAAEAAGRCRTRRVPPRWSCCARWWTTPASKTPNQALQQTAGHNGFPWFNGALAPPLLSGVVRQRKVAVVAYPWKP